MSYDGTEKEPAKRIKIKRSLVIFPFCRLLIVFCYIQLVYKLLRSGIIFKDSRHYRNHGSGSSVQSDGPPTGSFYSVIYYSCSIFILLILFKSDFFQIKPDTQHISIFFIICTKDRLWGYFPIFCTFSVCYYYIALFRCRNASISVEYLLAFS